jgi:prepilin-type N-terminal cleavage/methylation domain-containing protein
MRKRQHGFTLLEVLIASAILVVLVLFIFLLLSSTTDHYNVQSIQVALDAQGREALNEISKDLRMSKMDALVNAATGVRITTPSDTATYSDLQFRLPGPLPAGTRQLEQFRQDPDRLLTRRVRYTWIPESGETAADGVDNNRNGLIDEGMLQKIEEDLNPDGTVIATRKSRICPDVKRNGLTFKVPATGGAGRVELTLDLEKLDPKSRKRTITRTVQTTVELRN